MFHGVNPSLDEDVVSCCGHRGSFGSVSAGSTVVAQARYRPLVHLGEWWIAPDRTRGSKWGVISGHSESFAM